MSDIGEGIGTAIEAGLISRVIEPNSGARSKHPHQPDKCLNCETELVGAYCHACGQVGHIHRTIGAFGHDLLHGALHFEGKFWRTLPMLAIQPGRLTRRYIDGARARFVSPMALFLFAVFLMFAIFQMIGITAPTDLASASEFDGEDVEQVFAEVQNDAQSKLDEANHQLAQMAQDDPARAQIEQQAQDAQAALSGLEIIPAMRLSNDAEQSADVTGITWLDRGIAKKWKDNPSLMLYKLQANSYKFSWLLIPISIPFVWLMFAWKRRFKGYDHAIFVTYSLSFMTLLFVTLSVLGVIGISSELLGIAASIIPPIHIYKQLRGAYSLSRFSAIWRTLTLLFFITIIIVLFLQVLLLLGAV